MVQLEKIFVSIMPDLVVVQGDTASATAGALQAHALHIPIGHVEAGLRSRDLWNPWPEESNRRIIDSISTLHFAATKSAFNNLIGEGFSESISITGNTIVDALMQVMARLDWLPEVRINLESLLGFDLSSEYILFTQHRREGFGSGQEKVFEAILELARLGKKVVFPVHLNPAVQAKAQLLLSGVPGIFLIQPLPYLSFVELIKNCSLIISDSGGLQEEAPTFGKKIIITRKTTERPEILICGLGQLVGYDYQAILEKSIISLEDNNGGLGSVDNPFGNGNAAEEITAIIGHFLLAELKPQK